MRKCIGILACVVMAATLHAADVYHQVKEIAIGGEGGWDYLLVDSASHRLYVSHATKIVVADTDTGKIVGEIPDLPGVHGIAIAPDLGRAFTSNGRGNTSTIVDLKTLKPLGRVATGANPDSIRYSRAHKEVWTFNHTGKSVTVFSAADGKVLATIMLSGELEEAVEDPAANRMFVNIEDKAAIGVMDTVTHQVVATWPIADCEGPTGMAYDQKNHLILSACDGIRSGHRLRVRVEPHGRADDRARGLARQVHRGADAEDGALGPHDDARRGDAQRLRARGDDDRGAERPRADHAEHDEGARSGDGGAVEGDSIAPERPTSNAQAARCRGAVLLGSWKLGVGSC